MADPHSHGHEHEHPDHDHPDHDPGGHGLLGSFFTRHRHDSAASIDSALEASEKGVRALWVSLLGLTVTAVAQLVVVLLSGSVALLDDTFHNFADALTALPLWLAFSLGRRAANRRYTYGYGRAEDLAGVVIVAMIAFSAVVAGCEAVDRLLHPHAVHHLGWVVAAALVGFAGNELVARYRIRVGRRIGSAALVADGLHARTDGFTSLAVAGSAPSASPLGSRGPTRRRPGHHRRDPLVLRSAARDVCAPAHGRRRPRPGRPGRGAAGRTRRRQDVDELRLRWIGHRLHAEAEITVDADLTLSAAPTDRRGRPAPPPPRRSPPGVSHRPRRPLRPRRGRPPRPWSTTTRSTTTRTGTRGTVTATEVRCPALPG